MKVMHDADTSGKSLAQSIENFSWLNQQYPVYLFLQELSFGCVDQSE